MLVVISVIGIIASIAIPSIGSISNSAKTATYQRNAQSIVSMFAAGQAAGVVWTGATRNALVASVITGQAPDRRRLHRQDLQGAQHHRHRPDRHLHLHRQGYRRQSLLRQGGRPVGDLIAKTFPPDTNLPGLTPPATPKRQQDNQPPVICQPELTSPSKDKAKQNNTNQT